MRTTETCKSCGTLNERVLQETSLLVCKQCRAIVYENTPTSERAGVSVVPSDWSFVQIGTELQYNNDSLTIVGRIRLQLRNDYKNFWTASTPDGRHLWVAESFGSFAILAPRWNDYDGELARFAGGSPIKLSKELSLHSEYVEHCEDLSSEGEVGHWKFFAPGFYVIQASNNAGNTVLFFARGTRVQYLVGAKVLPEQINLKKIIEWNEWR